jgi:hypothetical protein
MQEFAFKMVRLDQDMAVAISYLIVVISAVITNLVYKVEFKIGRSTYFLSLGMQFLLAGVASLPVLWVRDAIAHDYLPVVVILIYGLIVPLGALIGISAAARSNDVFATRKRWFLALIPLANLVLVFGRPKDPTDKGVGTVTAIVYVVLCLLLFVIGRGITTYVEQQVAIIPALGAGDEAVSEKIDQYILKNEGLPKLLKDAVSQVRNLPQKVDSITTLTKVEADQNTLRYVYELSGDTSGLTQTWNDIMTNSWCKSDTFGYMRKLGATVEGTYVDKSGKQLALLRINNGLCDAWYTRRNQTMVDEAKAVKGPLKVDDVTTLDGASFAGDTFTYNYSVSVIPPNDNWKQLVKGHWCKLDSFVTLMKMGINIRGAYTYNKTQSVGEVLINADECSL